MKRHFDTGAENTYAKDQTLDPTECEKDMFARNVFGNFGEQGRRIVKAHRKSRLRELHLETSVKMLIKDGFEPPKIDFPTPVVNSKCFYHLKFLEALLNGPITKPSISSHREERTLPLPNPMGATPFNPSNNGIQSARSNTKSPIESHSHVSHINKINLNITPLG